MQHAITYSIVKHIDNQMPEANDVLWIYDGVTLTNRVKPFVTVEQMPTSTQVIAAERRDFVETYRFQVGLFTRSGSERSKLSEVLKSILRQSNIPFYDTRGTSPIEAGFFVCDVLAVTPIPVESASDETNKHRVYLDVEVEVYRSNANNLTFTQ
jgi:hypothetical protein